MSRQQLMTRERSRVAASSAIATRFRPSFEADEWIKDRAPEVRRFRPAIRLLRGSVDVVELDLPEEDSENYIAFDEDPRVL